MSYILCSIILIVSCAKPVNPAGGPPDKDAPVLNTEKSDKNFKTNFNQPKIELEFDEFINLTNASKEVIISPPLLYNPKISHRGKKLTIEFDEKEVLNENATYQINFGNAIKDINEGNKLENFSYVFSTGDKIDSLSISGTVYDDYTQEPEEEILVMLYDDLSDSIVYNERPLYFAKTDKNGKFQINNLRTDTFKVFALKDANVNYYYDNDAEKIGYLDSNIILTPTDTIDITLYSFIEQVDQKIISTDSKIPGLIKATLNIPEEEIEIAVSNLELKTQTFSWNDSLYIYYNPVPDSTFYIYAERDTIRISPRKSKARKLVLKKMIPAQNKAVAPKSKVELQFSSPIVSFQDSLIQLSDSSNTYTYSIRLNAGILELSTEQPDSTTTSLQLLPGAVSSPILSNTDTITLQITKGVQDDFGSVLVNATMLNPEYQYIFNLVFSGTTIHSQLITATDSYNFTFEDLSSGEYIMTIIEDRNKNGRWDPGSYKNKSKSEKILSAPLEKMRAGWNLNFDFDGLTFTSK